MIITYPDQLLKNVQLCVEKKEGIHSMFNFECNDFCIYTYVSTSLVCAYACLDVCMSGCMPVCTYVFLHAWVHICTDEHICCDF